MVDANATTQTFVLEAEQELRVETARDGDARVKLLEGSGEILARKSRNIRASRAARDENWPCLRTTARRWR